MFYFYFSGQPVLMLTVVLCGIVLLACAILEFQSSARAAKRLVLAATTATTILSLAFGVELATDLSEGAGVWLNALSHSLGPLFLGLVFLALAAFWIGVREFRSAKGPAKQHGEPSQKPELKSSSAAGGDK
ncbi:MAG: hypothetical protein HY906_13500 [Deltaproteobacteria bacterium]|nr:hypothetical protein [Deltaproteobacteria bacterium]